jgi:rhomboid family GlyGly-CTERM serine protease
MTTFPGLSLSRQGASLYLLALACLLLAPYGDSGFDLFALDSGPVSKGEYWRFWTGPLVHLSWPHLGLNLLGLILLQQMLGSEFRLVVWLWGYAIVSLAVGICFMAFSSFGYVVGLSAVLHGLFAFAACLAVRRDGLLATGVLLVVGAKVIWEKLHGPSAFIQDLVGLPVAADTHLYGYAAGLVLGTVMAVTGRAR